MNGNTAVGWIILILLMVFAFFGLAAVLESGPTQVTCTSTVSTYTCVTK